MIRILLADDHDVVRRGLRGILEEHEGWEVCAEATNGREAVELALALQPQVAVLDLAMPELNGLEATRQIKQHLPETEVLVFTMHQTEQLVHDVLAGGARGYVLKSDAARQLVGAVEALLEHKPYFTSAVTQTIVDWCLRADGEATQEPSPFGVLTGREREIVRLLAEGKSNKQIATSHRISVKTVETHRATIMRKLGLGSVVELVRYAIRHRLVEP
jgi:DNA-binding NarL/FixJ family response regulator